MVEAYANQKGLAFDNREELIANPEVIRLIESRVEHQRHLASYEKIKKFTLLAEPFTMENRELTDTLKLRRRVISEKVCCANWSYVSGVVLFFRTFAPNIN